MTPISLQPDDTIAALASAPGPGAIGILRISGPGVRNVLGRVFRPDDPAMFANARVARRYSGQMRLTALHAAIPVAVYFWPTARSYTGQPLAEIQAIGSPPLLEAALGEIYANAVRPARPGEFTLRAFLAGRIDLVQAEAVLGVIDAHDHQELEQALSQLAGGLSTRLTAVRSDLLDLLADIEAGLDFVEDDLEFVSTADVIQRLRVSSETLEYLLGQAEDRMQSTGRRRVVLAGLPNAGKSTLFNALVGRQAALVSHRSGTTRDYLSAPLDVEGTAIDLIDTAGWNLPCDRIDEQAQTLRNAQLQDAELILWCSAADFDHATRELDAQSQTELDQQPIPVLTVATKCDLNSPLKMRTALRVAGVEQDAPPAIRGPGAPFGRFQPPRGLFQGALNPTDDTPATPAVSAVTGAGLSDLVHAVVWLLSSAQGGNREFVGTTAARCRESLRRTITAVREAQATAEAGGGEEFVAVALRDALRDIGWILGAVYTDDILDRVFSRFCIGK